MAQQERGNDIAIPFCGVHKNNCYISVCLCFWVADNELINLKH